MQNTDKETGSSMSPLQFKEAPGIRKKKNKTHPSLYLVYNQIPFSLFNTQLPAYNLQEMEGGRKNKVMRDLTGGWKEGRMCALLTS